MNNKAVALFSGGLDSMLAIKLMLEQGVEVHALNFLTIFCTCTSRGCMHQATKAAAQLQVPLKVMNITEEYMEVVKHPKHGRGRNMNPCLDCRIFTFRKARDFMEEIGASFVITGEVLGERPMSQRRDAMEIIERESGLGGKILRPLCAKLFEPSLPEQAGVVDRDKLLDIQGRRRDRQIMLARELGVNDYPCPAGGCLLTDKGFSNRLKDLFKHTPDYDINDLHLLKVGRHFRIRDNVKLFIGRNEEENKKLISLSQPGDYVFDVVDIPSPIALARGRLASEEVQIASSILTRYSDVDSSTAEVSYKILPLPEVHTLTAQPSLDSDLSSLRI